MQEGPALTRRPRMPGAIVRHGHVPASADALVSGITRAFSAMTTVTGVRQPVK